MSHEGKGEDSIFQWGVTSNRRMRFKILGMSDSPMLIPHKNILRSVLGLNTVIILKRVREYIFFQSNKFTACKIRDGKGVAISLMVFNLRRIIHPFKNKKYLRT